MRLIEDLNSAYNYYKDKIDRDIFNHLISLDPTFNKSQDKLGTYGKWILARYLDPNSDVSENEGHIKDCLTRFDKEKSKLVNKDIMSYKTMVEIDKALSSDDSYTDLSHRQEVRQRQNARRNADTDKDLVYENGQVKIYSPSSYANSCKLGEGTSWCTASTEDDYYYNYYKEEYGGKYYILISTNSDEKYQFHFESWQFMDKHDNPVNPHDISVKLGCLAWFRREFFRAFGVPDIGDYVTADYLDEYLGNYYCYTADYLAKDNLTHQDVERYAFGGYEPSGDAGYFQYWKRRYSQFDPSKQKWTQEAEDALSSIGSSTELAKAIVASGSDYGSDAHLDGPHEIYDKFDNRVINHTWDIMCDAYSYACAKAYLTALRETAKHLGDDRMSITPAPGGVKVKISPALAWEMGTYGDSFWGTPYFIDDEEASAKDIIMANCLLTCTENVQIPEILQPSTNSFCKEIVWLVNDLKR